ncbi:hypothetical protein BT67DRAFT_220259 [Trichocladium antarcticum]|uniref:Uncharacterized protein n=1 Tax=Trichocladium antarcticum TaxID=1450529 RepID=A0AAN6UCF6_9PEZI|nr:hypothetical protein BT67DRAFT_220259 [Trichocladium antarcticum]
MKTSASPALHSICTLRDSGRGRSCQSAIRPPSLEDHTFPFTWLIRYLPTYGGPASGYAIPISTPKSTPPFKHQKPITPLRIPRSGAFCHRGPGAWELPLNPLPLNLHHCLDSEEPGTFPCTCFGHRPTPFSNTTTQPGYILFILPCTFRLSFTPATSRPARTPSLFLAVFSPQV